MPWPRCFRNGSMPSGTLRAYNRAMRSIAFFAAALIAAPPPHDAAADFALGRWDALYARFSPQMKAALSIQKLRQLGAFGRCQVPMGPAAPGRSVPGFETFVFKMECEKRTFGLSLTTDAQGVLQGMFIVEPPAAPTGLSVVTGEYNLPARLTLPKGPGPFPAAVLVHGSGPHDMDETIGPNKPFRDLADGLASRGIATLRYAKRTKQYGATLSPDITIEEETIQDAVSAAALLRSTPQIDPKRIYMIGHSLGAFAAPRIGRADPQLAGLILLAGNTRPLDMLIDEQVRTIGGTPAQAEEMKKMIPPAYRKDLEGYDPVGAAATLKMPMLILQGERDYQVTMEDFRGWQRLKGSRVTLKSYPSLNHLLQAGEGKSTPAEYKTAAPLSPLVLDDIAAWIKR